MDIDPNALRELINKGGLGTGMPGGPGMPPEASLDDTQTFERVMKATVGRPEQAVIETAAQKEKALVTSLNGIDPSNMEPTTMLDLAGKTNTFHFQVELWAKFAALFTQAINKLSSMQ